MKKFSCSKIKYFPADSVEGAKIINKNLSKEFGFKIAVDWSKCMKGGHRHNAITNAFRRAARRSKNYRKSFRKRIKRGVPDCFVYFEDYANL